MAAKKPIQTSSNSKGNPSSRQKSKTSDIVKERVVSENRKALHDYEILDTLECGIALVGSEVKSLRTGRMSLDEAYGRVEGNEVWLLGCDIPEYVKANQLNHKPKRQRKLLLHRREVHKFADLAGEKGLTLVPLKMYFKNALVKCEIAIGTGKNHGDKREDLKKRVANREADQALKKFLKG